MSGRPAAVLLLGVLHLIQDSEDPRGIVGAADFRGDAAVTTWLHRIVVNALLDRLRGRAVRPVVRAGDEQAFEALVAQDADPARAVDTGLGVDSALRILPPEQRAALVVVDMLGFSVADAAGRPPGYLAGTVKSRCARARARLLP
jgi:RNA polymerase sigma-70 factor (ECF subfamily)